LTDSDDTLTEGGFDGMSVGYLSAVPQPTTGAAQLPAALVRSGVEVVLLDHHERNIGDGGRDAGEHGGVQMRSGAGDRAEADRMRWLAGG
jgi:hypothetical protein